jgi:hypothetical protein
MKLISCTFFQQNKKRNEACSNSLEISRGNMTYVQHKQAMEHTLQVMFVVSSVQSTDHFSSSEGEQKHVLHYKQLIKTARFLTWRKGAEGDDVHGFVVPR